jgi:hypothetical protein
MRSARDWRKCLHSEKEDQLGRVHSAHYKAILEMVGHKCRNVADNLHAPHIMCI